jgi:hypothetical protein
LLRGCFQKNFIVSGCYRSLLLVTYMHHGKCERQREQLPSHSLLQHSDRDSATSTTPFGVLLTTHLPLKFGGSCFA